MNLLIALMNRECRQAMVGYCLAIGLVGLSVWAATGFPTEWFPPLVSWATAFAVSIVGGYWIVVRLLKLAQWEQRLSKLCVDDQMTVDANQLTLTGGSSPADFGWNRLVSAGRCWQSLTELEQSLASRLTNSSDLSGPPVLDSLSDGVATVDNVGNISYANSALAAICGVESAAMLIGRNLVEVLTTDAETSAMLEAAKPQSAIEWKIQAGTNQRTLQGGFRPGRKNDGSTIAYVWTIRDVTQQRLADAMRDQFLATATHEFRTPLANIRAYAESLEMGDDMDTESRKRFYNVIQCESTRLAQLVDDLLDISRMQAGALALESKETDLARLVDEIAAKVNGQIQEKQLEYRCELPPKFPPKIYVDKSKLSAALVNLLGNAAKYTPQGGRVTFRVDVTPHKILFTVTDTGIGISEEELPHVFERFYRSSDERVRELTGSGLGLALAHEVARLHGGDLTVESKLNQGSTFCMTIPLEAAMVS